MSILETIRCQDDLLALTDSQKQQLCAEIRDFLVQSVSQTGGHLASNLGVVELSVAIETIYNTQKDRLVFDVGHQSYVHKLLTGRQANFAHLRQFGGMAGFPKPGESVTDAFVAGHASSSVSIALGMARARTLQHDDYDVVAVIGDGATTGGVAFEGLNDTGASNEPIVVILNDNNMSIDRNVGGLSRYLNSLRSGAGYVGIKNTIRKFVLKLPGGKYLYNFTHHLKDIIKRMLLITTVFENMGFEYLGPVDGHDLPRLLEVLQLAKDMQKPVLVHVLTKKGKGFKPAEEAPSKFHGIGVFDPETGSTNKSSVVTFSDCFGETMVHLGQNNSHVCAITAAMPGGTGLLPFKAAFPERLFDVGIAEEHAVSMAGGLAKQGMVPVVAIYSTFLQRSFDMILQDISMLKLHVVLAVDRAGLVGEDGETHHGTFDVGFLRQAPGMMLLCPASLNEQKQMLTWAVERFDGPVAIRYPRGTEGEYKSSAFKDASTAVCCHRKGDDLVLITYGTLINHALQAADLLQQQGVNCTVLRLMTVSPLPVEQIINELSTNSRILVIEEVNANSGIKEALSWEIKNRLPGCSVDGIDLGVGFATHGAQKQLYTLYGLDAESIARCGMEVMAHEE